MLTRTTAMLLHNALKDAIAEIRQSYNEAEVSYLRMDIEVSGRVTGDLSVQYKFGADSYHGPDSAASHNILAALEEFLRRKNWAAKNSALLISYTGDENTENQTDTNEIPF